MLFALFLVQMLLLDVLGSASKRMQPTSKNLLILRHALIYLLWSRPLNDIRYKVIEAERGGERERDREREREIIHVYIYRSMSIYKSISIYMHTHKTVS